MIRGEPVSLARRNTVTARFLRALTVALAAVAGAAATERSMGEIILRSRETSAGADARANRSVMGEIVETDTGTDSRSDPGTVGAAASVSGASATSGASVSATVTADPAADTLEIIAAGSTSLFARRDAPTQDRISFSTASGSSNFRQTFDLTERSYEYTLAADTEVSVTQTPAGSRARAQIQLGSLFDQRIDERGFPFSTGSLSGVLTPGQYTISATAGGSYDVGQADATFALLLELTAASRWIDPAGGTFRVPDNWEASIVPGAANVAVFDLPGTYTVTLDQDVTNKRLRANGAGVNVSFDLNGNDYSLDTISIGGRDGDSVSVSFNDSSGPVGIAGAGAGDGVFQAAGHNGPEEVRLRARLLEAGKGGFANVTIPISTAFGQMASGGRVDVSGANAHWEVPDLMVGVEGTGLLEVSRGGDLTSQRAVLGDGAGPGSTIVTVSGQGSAWDNNGTLVVGKRRGALALIENRAIVTAHEIVIGELEGSSGIIEVSNASLLQGRTFSDRLTVGFSGSGALEVKNRALVEARSLQINSSFAPGSLSPGNGRVTVDSLGELRVEGNLEIGKSGDARLTINGGRAEQAADFFGNTQIGQRGVLEVLRGHFHERHLLTVNGTLAINAAAGSASVGQNKVETAGRLTVGPGGTLKGFGGIIRGKLVVLPGGINQFGGTVFPGTSTGMLTIDGDYEQTGGLLGIEIGGTAVGQFDVLAVTGAATIGGALVLEFIDGFAPRQGDAFNFLHIDGALRGAFDEIEVRNLMPGFQFDLRADGGGLSMVALNDGVFIPEPATLIMFFAGMLTVIFRRCVRMIRMASVPLAPRS